MAPASSNAAACASRIYLTATGSSSVSRFADGIVHYQNAFVRTPKFIAEEEADTFRFATWSMRRPGGLLANLGGGSARSQAGVTVYPFKDILYAFDEISPAYGLDPQTLETLGEQALGDPAREFMIKAHTKFDPLTGEWLLFGISHGRSMKLHAIIHSADGALKAHHVIAVPAPDLHPRLFRHARTSHLRSTSDVVFAVAVPQWTGELYRIALMETRRRQSGDGRSARRRYAAVFRSSRRPSFGMRLTPIARAARSSPISSAMTPPIISRHTMLCSTS